jgi:DNA helicase-2/ATP-dependent DNA helicase PcrA
MSIAKEVLDSALGFNVSAEQWEVISAPLGPAVVVAGAGSGKTTAMAARVAWLVASEFAEPGAVLGLTFTNKAAASLLRGIRSSLRALGCAFPDGAEPVVQTYNGFAARILREHGVRLGREPGSTILVDGARQQLAYRVVCRTDLPLDRFGKSPATLTGDLLHLDDQCSELDIDPVELMAFDSKLLDGLAAHEPLQVSVGRMRDAARLRLVLAELVQQWRQEKHRRDVLDFTDQTRLALQIVRDYPEVAATIRADSSVVLLDEYQDTSLAQRRLLQGIFAEGHPVTAVGDPCQAIYGWRGASVDNIDSFPHHFPAVRKDQQAPAPRYRLSVNRRSAPEILAVANDVFSSLRDQHDGVVELVPGATEVGPGRVECGLFETAEDERAWIVERIRSLGLRQRAWGSIAVLAATGRELAELDTALRAVGVPTQFHGAAGLLRQPVIVDLRSMLEVVHDPVANPELIRLLSGPRWQIGVRDLAALGARAMTLAGGGHRAVTVDVADALDEAVAGADPSEAISLSDAVLDLGDLSEYSEQAVDRLQAFASELRTLRRHASEPALEFVLRIARVTGLDVECALAGPQQQRAWSTFVDLAAEFTDLEGRSSLGAFLARLDDAERFDVDLSVDAIAQPDAVQLMTIHKAKGLEFSHVLIPAVAKGAFPGGRQRGEWTTSASVVPWPLRMDAPVPLRDFPDLGQVPRDKHMKAYRELLNAVQELDDQRLAYVAMTRAKSTLVVTGHWWGPTQSKPRGPEPYLSLVRQACLDGAGEVIAWAEEPTQEFNPSAPTSGSGHSWPSQVDPQLAAAATAVRQAMEAPATLPGMPRPGLSPAEEAVVAGWDLDARLLVEELRRERSDTVMVQLPTSVSASTMIRALRDPQGLAADLARPMPAAPSPQARRGTAFHAWVQTRYGQQSLLDPADLPGAADEDIDSDADLEALKEAFEASAFAMRMPVAVELPFAILLGGRVVRGRIDAVFESNGRIDIIDWKTGSAQGIDPGQLAVYALAWSQLRGVPLDAIDAGFWMVATGEVIRPEEWRSLAEDLLAMSAGADPVHPSR